MLNNFSHGPIAGNCQSECDLRLSASGSHDKHSCSLLFFNDKEKSSYLAAVLVTKEYSTHIQ